MKEKVIFHRHEKASDGSELPEDRLFGFFEIAGEHFNAIVSLSELLYALKQEELKLLSNRINSMIRRDKK